MEASGKHDVLKKTDKEKREASAVPVTGRKPEDTSVSPPLKARTFEKYIYEAAKVADVKENLLRIPEGVVRKVLSGNDRAMSYRMECLRSWIRGFAGLRSTTIRSLMKRC